MNLDLPRRRVDDVRIVRVEQNVDAVGSSPIWRHVAPACIDLKAPAPMEIWLRMKVSPVPAQTMLLSDGAMASAPIDATFCASKIGVQ